MSKSDPFCIVQMKESWQNNFFEIGRTEQIDDNLSPEWVKKFILNYNFETIQKIRFEIWDKDPSGNDFLGEYETTLADIVSYNGRQFRGKLKNQQSSNAGHVVIVTEEVSSCKEIIQMSFQATALQKQCWLMRNDPFLVFSRSNEDGSFSVVMKSEVVNSTQSPKWKPLTIKGRTLCNGDNDRTIKIDCYDNRSDGDHKLIGSCQTSLRALKEGPGSTNQYRLRKNVKSKDYTGTLELTKIAVTEEISFLDYIRGGTQMHFAVAIDFTASNGSPMDPQSLHFLSSVPNSYEIALRSVGDIIQSYDTSQMYPAFGRCFFIRYKIMDDEMIFDSVLRLWRQTATRRECFAPIRAERQSFASILHQYTRNFDPLPKYVEQSATVRTHQLFAGHSQHGGNLETIPGWQTLLRVAHHNGRHNLR